MQAKEGQKKIKMMQSDLKEIALKMQIRILI